MSSLERCCGLVLIEVVCLAPPSTDALGNENAHRASGSGLQGAGRHPLSLSVTLGLGLRGPWVSAPFHVASFRIRIHLKWFGLLCFPPRVCCRETPTNAHRAAQHLCPWASSEEPHRPHQDEHLSSETPRWGPTCCSLKKVFFYLH